MWSKLKQVSGKWIDDLDKKMNSLDEKILPSQDRSSEGYLPPKSNPDPQNQPWQPQAYRAKSDLPQPQRAAYDPYASKSRPAPLKKNSIFEDSPDAKSEPKSNNFSFTGIFKKNSERLYGEPPAQEENIFSSKDLDKLYTETFMEKNFDREFYKSVKNYEPASRDQKIIVSTPINRPLMDYFLSACRDLQILNAAHEHNMQAMADRQISDKGALNEKIEPFKESRNDSIEHVFSLLPVDFHSKEFRRLKDDNVMKYGHLRQKLVSVMHDACIENNSKLKEGGVIVEFQKEQISQS
jgi:hypothetical protein